MDGIRILSSIVVCTSHAFQIFLSPKLGANNIVYLIAGHAASYAVVIFFMLSGYMVTNSIFNNKAKNGFFNYRKYWKDRLLRLYPPLLFAIGLSILIYLVVKIFHMHGSVSFRLPGDIDLARESIEYSIKEIGISLFFIQGIINTPLLLNGPLWSLGDEFFLYMIASFVSTTIFNKVKILPIILTALFFITVYFTGHLKTALYLYMMWGAGAFFSIEKNKLNGYIGNKLNGFICLFLILILISVLIKRHFILPDINYELISTSAVIQFSFLLFCVFLFRFSSINWQFKIAGFFEKITPKKDFTYTLYVIHFPILLFCFSIFHVWLNSMSIYATIAILLILIPAISLLANLLAHYLEDKKRIESLYYFLKNQLNTKIFYRIRTLK